MADGNLTFDTKLNLDGFNQGVRDMEAKVKQVSKLFDGIKTALSKATQTKNKTPDTFSDVEKSANSAKKAAEEGQAALEQASNAGVDYAEKLSVDLDRMFETQKEEMEKWESIYESNRVRPMSISLEDNAARNKQIESEIEALVNPLEEVKTKLQEVKTESKNTFATFIKGDTKTAFKNLANSFNDLRSKMKEANTFSFSGLIDSARNAQGAIQQWDGFISRLAGKFANLKQSAQSSFAGLGEKISSAFSNLGPNVYAKIDFIKEKLYNAFQSMKGLSLDSISGAFQSMAVKANGALGSLANGARYAGTALKGVLASGAAAAVPVLGALAAAAGTALLAGLKKVGQAALNAGKHLLKAFGSGIKSAISGIANGVMKLASSLKGALISAVKRAASSFTSLKKGASEAGKGVTGILKKFTSLGSMLTRMLKRRLLLSLINGAKEGIQNLAQASPAFNAAMSDLKSSLTMMKNSFASAFGSLLPIVLPVLKTIIGWLSTAANYIAQFFAALSGAKTFKKAVAVQEDYAASLDKSTKSAKELKNELLGFDKITKLQDDSSSGSGGGGGVNPSSMFEDATIDSSISQFVQDLKDAWNAEDFTAVGEIIGNKLNEMVNKVDELIKWDNVGDKITKWINNIGTAFNSLMDTVDWENIGKTIGDGLNTATYSIDAFFKAFDLEKLGTAASEIANGLNDTVDWKAIGQTIADGLNEATGAINNFADNTNWESIGSNFASSVNSLLDNVDGEALGKALSAKLKIGLELADGFVKEFHWSDLGSTLSDVVDGWFGNIDWETLGSTIATGLNGIADTITTFADETDWQDKGDKIGSALSSLVDGVDADKIGGALAAPFNMLIKSVDGFLKNFEKNGTWSDAGEKIGKAISSWFQTIDWKTAASNLTKGADGIVEFIKKAFENIQWSEIGTKLGTLINGVFKIDWKDVGKTISEGASGILDFFTSALDTIEWADLGKAVVDFITGIEWGELFKKAIKLLAKLGEGIGLILKGAWNAAIDALIASDNIPDWLKKMLGKVKFKEEDLKMKSDELAEDVEKTLSDSVQKHGGDGGKFEVPATVKYDSTQTDDYKNNKEDYLNLKDRNVTLTAEAKEKTAGAMATLEKGWKSIDSKNPELVANAKEKVAGSLPNLEKQWNAIIDKNPQMSAEAKEKIQGALAALKNNWDAVDNKDPVLKAEAREKVENALSTLKKSWDAINDKTPTATLNAEPGQNFSANKKAYDDLNSKKAKADLLAEKGQDFDTNKKAYDNFKDKEVTATAKLGTSATTVRGWWTNMLNWFRGGNEKNQVKTNRSFTIGATQSTKKTDASSWWTKIKNFWGTKSLGITGSMTVTKASIEKGLKASGSLSVETVYHGKNGNSELRMQVGGIVTHPTRALVGENGPEAIIPLKNNTQWLDTVGQYVVNHLPGLAKGTVIPANYGSMLAVLGDNKKETEVVSPLSTMKKAMVEAMQQMGFGGNETQNINLSLNLDGQVIYNEVVRINKRRTRAGGVNPLVV